MKKTKHKKLERFRGDRSQWRGVRSQWRGIRSPRVVFGGHCCKFRGSEVIYEGFMAAEPSHPLPTQYYYRSFTTN